MQVFLKILFAAFLWILFIYISAFVIIILRHPDNTKVLILLTGIVILIAGIFLYYRRYPVKDRKSLFGKIIRYGFIGLFLFMFLNIPNIRYEGNHDRAKLSSVKANMHQIQTMLETYAIDYEGFYPNNLSELYKEANIKKYWNDFNNPFSGSKDMDQAWMSLVPVKPINQKTGITENVVPGAVVYDPINDKGKITVYYIYGASKTENILILDKDKVYYLSNF